MPLPPPLDQLVTTRRFWTDYLFVTETDEDYAGLEGLVIALPLDDDLGLVISLDEGLAYTSLGLVHPGGLDEIAWDDQAHWHPHVLRWSELERICEAVAVRDPALAHPGWPLLFLHRFAPICLGDEVERIATLLQAAWDRVGAFTPADVQALIERNDLRSSTFRWSQVDEGWVLGRDDEDAVAEPYSLRRPGADPPFPFAGLRSLVARAEELVAGAGGPGPLPPLARPLATLRERHSFSLEVPVTPDFPDEGAKLLQDSLTQVLLDAKVGEADVTGSTSEVVDGVSRWVDTTLDVTVQGDRTWGLRLIRHVLWWSAAPPTIELSKTFGDAIPLDLREAPEGPGELWLHLCTLSVHRWSDGHRIDRLPLEDPARETMHALLARAGASERDEEGWCRVGLARGAHARACLSGLDQDPELGVTLVLSAPTPEACELTFALMHECRLFLMPLVAVSRPELAERFDAAWPPVHCFESPQALHAVLREGPYVWWRRQRG